MKKVTSSVQDYKNQAQRLSEYLNSVGRTVTRTQALEAVSRSVHGKPWNTVRALSEQDKSALLTPVAQALVEAGARAETGAAVVATYLTFLDAREERRLFSVVASLATSVIVSSVNLNSVLQGMTDELVLSLIRSDKTRWPEVYQAIEQGHGVLHRGRTASEVTLSFSTTFGDGFAVWLKAFRPQLYWELLACRIFGGLERAAREDCYVKEDNDQPGRWVYVYRGEGCDISTETRLEAEVYLATRLEWDFDDHENGEFLQELSSVQAGSGLAEQDFAKVSSMAEPVEGRDDKETGSTMFLSGAALSTADLISITANGSYGLDIVVPVSIWGMVNNDQDWLIEKTSEFITGSHGGLEMPDFSHAQARADAPALDESDVWIRVRARWVTWTE